jgi:transposase
VAVTYEAGPTGFGLARALRTANVRCEVVAPSKLERPPGDRVKTDRRDARRLCRLLHVGEIDDAGAVRVPTQVQEDARDLVRAREAVRADLMRARHRLSKLLLRHGIVYSGGQAWTGAHEAWPRPQRFDRPGTRAAFEEYFDAVLSVTARRDRLDHAIFVTAAAEPWAPIVARLGAVRGVATLTGLGLAVEIGDWTRFPAPASMPTSAWSPASPPAAPAAARARSPRPATPMRGGCWSKRPGTTRSRCGRRARLSPRDVRTTARRPRPRRGR